jgi:hypothetical protein
MSMTPIYAPYIQTYAQHAPYVTIDEFIAAPNGINLSDIVPKTDDNTNRQALAEVLSEASSEADQYCNQVLAATAETYVGTRPIPSDGRVLVAVANWPIVAVTGYSYGYRSDSLTAATDLSGVTIESLNTLKLPALTSMSANFSLCVTVSYVAGYHNSFTQAASAAADVTVTVDNTLGLVPGMRVSIFDPLNGANELATVLSTTATTITFTAGLRFGHPSGVRVSMMPAAIKRAILLVAGAIIRSKFAQSVVIPGTGGGQPTVTTTTGARVKDDRSEAEKILGNFARVI